MKQDSNTARRTLMVLFSTFLGLLVLPAAAAYAYFTYKDGFHQTPTVAKTSINAPVYKHIPTQDKDLYKVLKTVATDSEDIKDISIIYSKDFKDNQVYGTHNLVADDNDYQYRSLIKIKKDLSRYPLIQSENLARKSLVAHEYLHHVWHEMDETKRAKLESSLLALYSKDSDIQNRMSFYSDKEKLSADEMFAIYCTESSDPYLSSKVIAACNEAIDRSSLQMIR